MKLYNTSNGQFIEDGNQFFHVNEDWNTLINRKGLHEYLKSLQKTSKIMPDVAKKFIDEALPNRLLRHFQKVITLSGRLIRLRRLSSGA